MIIASGFSKCIISLIVLLWHFKNVWLRACVLPSFPREYISPWAGVFTCFWCLCCFESGLIACGKAVAHAHVAYVLKSCCFSFSYLASFHWSPICPVLLIYLHHPSHFLPPVERTACGAHRQKKARQAQDLTERIQRPPGPVEQQLERTPPPENGESTRICMNHHTLPPPALSFDLTSICFSFPQVLPPSLWLLMSSKMTSPPHPHPRSSTALTNHQLFLHCRGSQVTNYWATARLWSRPLTTVPVMLRWRNGTKYIVLIKTHIFWKKWALSYNHGQTY